MNLFASALNKKLLLYCFLLPDPIAWQEDAFLVQWDNLDAYTFSPFSLILRGLNWLLTFQCLGMTLITPCWPHLEWFLDLLSLLVDFLRDFFMAFLSLSTSVIKVPSKHSSPQPSHLEVVQCVLREKGLCQRTAQAMARTVERSSSDVYQGR